MKYFFAGIASLVLITGCATNRATPYEPHGPQGGYSDSKVDEHLKGARFAGNQYTDKKDVIILSKFRAQEICNEQGYKFARIFGLKDVTVATDVQMSTAQSQVSGGGMFSYFRGNAQGQSWKQTIQSPSIDTYFTCSNKVYTVQTVLKVLTAEDVKLFVKDLMGAIQVQDILSDSPNKGILQRGDILLRANGERVTTVPQIAAVVDASPDKEKIVVDLIRDGHPLKTKVKAIDTTESNLSDANAIISTACQMKTVKKRPLCSTNSDVRTPASR